VCAVVMLALAATVCAAQEEFGTTTTISITGSQAEGYSVSAYINGYANTCDPYDGESFDSYIQLGLYSGSGTDTASLQTPAYSYGPGSYTVSGGLYGWDGYDYSNNEQCTVDGSSATQVITISPESPHLVITPPAQDVPEGSTLTIPVSVNVPNAYVTADPPTGTVSLYYGSTNLATAKLGVDSTGQNGQAIFSLSTKGIALGSYSLTAVYSGDTNYYPVTSSAFNVTVGPAATVTTTTFSAAPNPVILSTSITLTAQVTPEVNNVSITGVVTFSVGATKLGQATVNSNGSASLTMTVQGVSPGTYNVAAQYGGDSHYQESSGGGQIVVIAQGTTATSVSATPQSVVQSQSATIDVSVAPIQAGNPAPTGTIALNSGSLTLAKLGLSSGTASYTASTKGLSPGAYPLTASYSGNSLYASSSSTQIYITVLPGVSMAVSASPNPVTQGQVTVLSATVTALPGNGSKTPTGTVSFIYNGSTLGSATLGTSGEGTLPVGTGGLAAGTDAITVNYSGDPTFASSTATLNLVDQ